MATTHIQEVISMLSKHLFEAEYRRLDQEIIRLDAVNREMLKLQYKGFVYNGKVYIPKDATVILKGPKPALAYELTDQMNQFLKDLYTINFDKKMIEQVLYTLLYQCPNSQSIRDSLPECMVSLVPEFSNYRRLRPTAYIIKDDERAMNQFTKALPKIEFYSATQLLY